MHRTFTYLTASLLLILVVSLLWMRTSPRNISTGSGPGVDGLAKPRAQTQDATQVAHSSTATQPQVAAGPSSSPSPSPSSPFWRPSAVFGKTMVPVPVREFPRGEHFTRRYHESVSREVDPALASQAPAVLARSPEDRRYHLLPEEIDKNTRIAGRMVFDPSALEAVIAGQTSRILAPTLSEEVLTLEFKQIKTRSANTHTLQGHVVGEETISTVQIVYHDGILHGSVMRYASHQEIEYRILADGHMMVRELDHSTMKAGCGTCDGEIMADIVGEHSDGGDENPDFASEPEPPISYDTTGWRTIDITVGYTIEARTADGGHSQIEARIIASVDRMTSAFANSAITNTELVLLGTIEDPDFVEHPTSRVSDAHVKLRNLTDGHLDAVTDLHQQLGSDLASIVVSSTQSGGLAGVAVTGSWSSATARSQMTAGQMTFEHELGHNLGCGHGWGDTSTSATGTNLGWRFQGASSAKHTTIMAYTHVSGWGPRIPYFSNPNVLHPDGNVPTGCVAGYDATNDTTVDPALKPGYDDSVSTRGANNAGTIDTGEGNANFGATVASNRATRTAFDVISPAAAAQWERGTTQTIRFNGGDMQDLATIQLYKDGVLHTTLASNVNPSTHRNFTWTIPLALTEGTDYMIRVELVSNGSTLMADSGIFRVFSDPPYVINSSAPAVPEGVGVVSKVVLTFNVSMDPATFSPGSDIVSFTDPIGNSVISSITDTVWSAENSVLTIHFTPQSQLGTYQLVIGPDIADTSGILMDQDRDGVSGESVDDRHISQFVVNPPIIYSANMDSDPGWTFSANNPATEGWAYGQPTGQGANPFRNNDPNSGFTGPNVVGYNLNGDYQNSIPDTRWATTPAFDCSGHQDVILSFKRWLGVNAYDHVYIQVSNDGASWTTVWENPNNQHFDDNAWAPVEYDISAVADGQATVYVRWGLGLTLSNFNGGASGWNIDDVVVYGNSPDNLAVTPAGGLASSGVSGGPFSPTSIEYTLQNTGSSAIQWTAGKTANWVSLSAASGTLAAGASTTVTVSINSLAEEYQVGAYSDLVTFTNATAGVISATRSVDLEVLGPGTLVVSPAGDFVSSGVYGGLFSPASFEYTLTNGGVTPIDWSAVKTQTWVTLSPAAGSLAPGASTTLTVSINQNADALSVGSHADTVSFLNLTNESGNTTRGVSLTVYPPPVDLYWDANGNTAGAGGTPTGTWGTSNFWNTDSAGGAGTFSPSTAITSNLFFVAGPASNSGNGNATITVSGAQGANSLTSQHSGAFTITGGSSNPLGSISLGNGTTGQGGITVNEFAFGSTAQGKLSISAPVSLNNSQTWTNHKVDADFRQQAPGLDFTAAAGSAPNGLTLSHALTIDGKGVTSLSSNTATTITGTGGIIKNGTGTLILSTANAANSGWSGGLTVNGGIVRFQNASNLGTGNINLAGGVLEGRSGTTSNLTTLSLGAGANQIRITGGVSGFSGQNTTASVFTISGTDPLVWGSANFAPSEFVLQASTANTNGKATFTNGINLNSGTRTIRSDQTGGLAGGGVATFSGAITGTGNLIKTGIGHVFLSSSSNNYNGTTTVSQGTLTVENIGSLPGRNTPGMVTVAAGATLGVRPGSWGVTSIDSLRVNVTWSATSSELGFFPTSSPRTYASNITEALSIHKYGANTILVLTGTSTYPGTTTISQGTLQLGDGTTGKDGTIEGTSGIINNAALIFNRFGNLSSNVDISGTGTVTKSGAGTQTLSGVNTYTGATTVSAGTLFINGSLSNTNVALTVNNGATLGGTGTIGRNVTIATGGKLEFNLSTAAASHDRLDISSGRSFAFSGASELTITSSGGAAPGIYTLITGGNNITGNAPATLNLPSDWVANVSISGNSLLLNVTSTGGPGPVDHFVISAIASPQTVGTAITGITITAQDAANETATSFTGTVTFGGTAGVTGTSANFTDGVLSGVSITPTALGPDLTFTVDDGAGNVGLTNLTVVSSAYQTWASVNNLTGESADPGAVLSGDNLTNLQKFAFGMDPAVSFGGTIAFDGATLTTPGTPFAHMQAITETTVDFRAVFGRHKDHLAAGVVYSVQFSAGLDEWVTSTAVPVIMATDDAADVDAVYVPYPSFIGTADGFKKPTFFRVGVSME